MKSWMNVIVGLIGFLCFGWFIHQEETTTLAVIHVGGNTESHYLAATNDIPNHIAKHELTVHSFSEVSQPSVKTSLVPWFSTLIGSYTFQRVTDSHITSKLFTFDVPYHRHQKQLIFPFHLFW